MLASEGERLAASSSEPAMPLAAAPLFFLLFLLLFILAK
jgi:hypothetical protein